MSDIYDSANPGGAPGAGQVTWTNTMAAIFLTFKPCMDMYYSAIDLSSYDSVIAHMDGPSGVAAQITQGNMPEPDPANPPPPDGTGPDYVGMWNKLNGLNNFNAWQQAGYPK